ncbi:unnamed protein product [Parnassius apollo]|uniref:(apollo) hypothetical protein n=1 Tax=Parnassius apollo TaxID=110799 RepID=A0A8S3XP78_PARAO|nr:unnamed protein product [Parnassius apollo]
MTEFPQQTPSVQCPEVAGCHKIASHAVQIRLAQISRRGVGTLDVIVAEAMVQPPLLQDCNGLVVTRGKGVAAAQQTFRMLPLYYKNVGPHDPHIKGAITLP